MIRIFKSDIVRFTQRQLYLPYVVFVVKRFEVIEDVEQGTSVSVGGWRRRAHWEREYVTCLIRHCEAELLKKESANVRTLLF